MATKRRKTTRRRSTRRRRNLGAVPIYPPVLGITGMPLTFAPVGPLAGLGSSPEEHRRQADLLRSSIQDQLESGKNFAIRGDCELALHRLVGAAKNFGAYVAERIGSEDEKFDRARGNKLETEVGQLRDVVNRCFVRKRG